MVMCNLGRHMSALSAFSRELHRVALLAPRYTRQPNFVCRVPKTLAKARDPDTDGGRRLVVNPNSQAPRVSSVVFCRRLKSAFFSVQVSPAEAPNPISSHKQLRILSTR